MAKLIEDVEAPKESIIKYEKVINILENKKLSKDVLYYVKELLNGRDIIDMSGYSGKSTILIPSRNSGETGYCIKFSDQKGILKNEKELLSLFSRYDYTSKIIDYISDSQDILITEQIKSPLALSELNNIKELATFMGESLRKFHDTNWNSKEIKDSEYKVLRENSEKIISESLLHDEGLTFMANYQDDYNFSDMKKYIADNIDLYQKDDVIIHGDFNPRNVFVNNNKLAGFVDVTDSAFGDRHYDIYWTMWTISLYLGVQGDIAKVLECENTFLEAYGYDKIDQKRLTLCKKINCMYWQENNDIKYFDR